MTLNRIEDLRIWANLETQVAEPPTLLQDEGYHPLEQPYCEHHNWIWNVRDKKLNQLIRERNLAQRISEGTTLEDWIAGRNRNFSWAHPYTVINGATFTGEIPICICRAFDYVNNRECVYVGHDGKNDGLHQLTLVPGPNALINDIPLTFNEGTEYPEAIASEGDAFYVMTKGHSSGNVYFYRFSANPLSPTPVWTHSESGSNFKSLGRNAMCITSEWLCFVRTDVNAASNSAIGMIRKSDAGAFRNGGGNFISAVFGSDYRVAPSICARGDSELFFTVYNQASSGEAALCGADIADPTQATYPGGSWFAKSMSGTVTAGIWGGDVIHDGELIHFTANNGNLYTYDWDTDTQSSSPVTPRYVWSNAKAVSDRQEFGSLAFDGFRLYTLIEFDGSNSDNNSFISMVDCATASIDQTQTPLTEANSPHIFLDRPRPTDPATYNTKMVCTHNELWIIPRITTPEDRPKVLWLRNITGRGQQ